MSILSLNKFKLLSLREFFIKNKILLYYNLTFITKKNYYDIKDKLISLNIKSISIKSSLLNEYIFPYYFKFQNE